MPKVPAVRRTIALLGLVITVVLLGSVLSAWAQGLKPTNEWVNFYGLSTTFNSAPVPAGAVITAYDPGGVLCGQFVVHTAGQYGVMPVYRDDPMTAEDEGASPGDTISFRINGQPATTAGPDAPVWSANGAVLHVELRAGSGAPASPTPTTAVSPATTATPTTIPLPSPTATSGSGSAPEWVNFYGTNSTLDGAPLPVGALVEAWSSDGVKCGEFRVTTAGSYGVLACQRSLVGTGGMQPGGTVHFTVNGRAALPLGPDPAIWSSHGDRKHVELEVPPVSPIPTTPVVPTATPTTAGTVISPEWVNFYGTASTLDGAPLPVGAVVEAFGQDGTRCGSFTVTTPGSYGVLACQRSPVGVPGAHPGDIISFRINGRPATPMGPDSPIWTTHGDRRHVELSVAPLTPIPTNTVRPTATPTLAASPGAPEWVNFYGTASTYEGAPLPVGAVVVAWSPDGVQCGSFTVTTPGSYGLLACQGSPIGLPGAHPGDTIYFTINGRAALAMGPDTPIWTSNGDRRHVELQIPASTATPTRTPTRPVSTPTTPAGTATATATRPAATATVTATRPAATATRTLTPTRVPTGGPCVGFNYTVVWGDYLYKIARRFGVSAADILRCNYLPNPNCLRPGQRLLIPGPVPPTTPVPTPAATITPQPGCTIVYIVRPGDTLSLIARRYNTTVWAIMSWNGLVNPNYIYVGQRLVIYTCQPPIPDGRRYVVRYGDTLWQIALRFGVNVWRLAVANNLYYPYIIYPGQVLVIP